VCCRIEATRSNYGELNIVTPVKKAVFSIHAVLDASGPQQQGCDRAGASVALWHWVTLAELMDFNRLLAGNHDLQLSAEAWALLSEQATSSGVKVAYESRNGHLQQDWWSTMCCEVSFVIFRSTPRVLIKSSIWVRHLFRSQITRHKLLAVSESTNVHEHQCDDASDLKCILCITSVAKKLECLVMAGIIWVWL
jgi:hypothetical protein